MYEDLFNKWVRFFKKEKCTFSLNLFDKRAGLWNNIMKKIQNKENRLKKLKRFLKQLKRFSLKIWCCTFDPYCSLREMRKKSGA